MASDLDVCAAQLCTEEQNGVLSMHGGTAVLSVTFLSVAETADRLGCTSTVGPQFAATPARSLDRYHPYRPRQWDERRQHLACDSKQMMTQFDTTGSSPASKRTRALLPR